MTHDTDTKSRLQFLKDPNTLATALQTGHDYVEELVYPVTHCVTFRA